MSTYSPSIDKNAKENPVISNLYSIVNGGVSAPVANERELLSESGQEILTEDELLITTE